MLELRPICEHCAKPLPPDSDEARICSFECTFCRACVDGILDDVCPNCGGNFVPRPIRPRQNWHGGNHLRQYPATATRKHRPVDIESHRALIERLRRLSPQQR